MKKVILTALSVMMLSCNQVPEADTTGNFYTYYNHAVECDVIANEYLNKTTFGTRNACFMLWIVPDGTNSRLYLKSDFHFSGRQEWKNDYKRTVSCRIKDFKVTIPEKSNNGILHELTDDLIDSLYNIAQSEETLTGYLMPETGDTVGEGCAFDLTELAKTAIRETINKFRKIQNS